MGYFCSVDGMRMKLFLQKILFTCCFLVLVSSTNAQVNISMSVSPAQIHKNEFTTLKISIENSNEVQQVTPPSFKDFIVLSGPNQESGMSSVNGNVKRYTSLSFILKPKRPGKFSINAATVKIGGKEFNTNPAVLTVSNTASSGNPGSNMPGNMFPGYNPMAPARPSEEFKDYIFRKGDNIADKVSRNMMMKLQVDKSSCFVGEPIVATYKLYTRLKSDSKLTENPSFNGFSVIDLTNQDTDDYTREKINGREFNVYIIRKAQLYPLQPGNIELETAELENNIQFIKDEYANSYGNDISAIFNDFSLATVPAEGIINQTVNLSSNRVSIEVKALPENNKPANFTGAVGNFSMDARLQKSNFPANETGKLQVAITGSGNLQMLTAPSLDWPAGIDAFEPETGETINKAMVPVYGKKVFEYGFSADKPGNYILPAVSFSFFDPATASYKTISTKPFPFTVSKPTETGLTGINALTSKEPVTGINRIFNNRWWIILFIGIAVIAGLAWWLKKEKKQAVVIQKNDESEAMLQKIVAMSAKNQENPLIKSETCLNRENCNEFYSLLNSELKTFLAQKFNTSETEINTANIAVIMDKNNISNDTILQLQQLLRKLEWILYTPFERNEKMETLYQEAQDMVQLINTYSFRHL